MKGWRSASRGQGLVEYILLVALAALASVGATVDGLAVGAVAALERAATDAGAFLGPLLAAAGNAIAQTPAAVGELFASVREWLGV